MADSRPVNRAALIDSAAFIAISIVCLVEGFRLNVTANPHALSQRLAPGYYVVLLGAILLVAGIVHLVGGLRRRDKPASRRAPAQAAAMTVGLAGIVAALVLYAIMVTLIGYAVGTAVFFLVTFAIFNVRPWPLTIALSLGLAGVCYALFANYLGIIFPRGLLF
jgi:hypothetical protein